MNQLKSIYNSPFKDLYSHPIHTCFPIIASNGSQAKGLLHSCVEQNLQINLVFT